jgi:hypothetical protein
VIDESRLRACLASNGLSVATLLDESGIPAGAPVPTLDGGPWSTSTTRRWPS